MAKAPRITGKQLLAALQKSGFTIVRTRGSAHILQKGQSTVSIHIHAGDVLKQGTLGGILDQAGLTVDELRELL
ncbi:MAG: type II toxin-antitoxin system HicA family toxin [Chloroflexota bacterium]|nr:type II toxin-antitoxin system HicA family toxin [Chloroflexota bacterium]